VEGAAEESCGARPLPVSQYYTRLTQRLVAALTAPTSEGVLYQADMRLRPSGNAGPLATTLSAFRRYQQEAAWTWEHLALTRARVVEASEGFGERIAAAIEEALGKSPDPGKIVDDVVTMRALVAKERPPRHPFDLKLRGGGLIDLEFIAQSAQLLARTQIDLRQAPTADVLVRLGQLGLVPEGARLAEIHGVYSTILQTMSAALVEPFADEAWTRPFRELLAQLCNVPDYDRLKDDIEAMTGEVKAAAARWYERAKGL
jgi:glutamate-ammonia-ligase adenylyltransferase